MPESLGMAPAAPADPAPPSGVAAARQLSIRPLLIGHRGASGHRPEHTTSAYRLAFDAGVDAIEPDVVVSRDGVLLVRHENEISGTTDVASRPEFADRRTQKVVDGMELDGWFAEDLTWAELETLRARERVPEIRPASAAADATEPILRLRDVLQLVDQESRTRGREFSVVIELKHVEFLRTQGHDLVELLLLELADCGWDDRSDRLVVECFELTPLQRLRVAGLRGRLVFLMEHGGGPADTPSDPARSDGEPVRDYAWYRSDAGLTEVAGRGPGMTRGASGIDGISLDKWDILHDRSIVERAHAHGLMVFTWTLRPENCFLDPEFRAAGGEAEWGAWQGEWRRIREAGVDGVFLDHPELWRRIDET